MGFPLRSFMGATPKDDWSKLNVFEDVKRGLTGVSSTKVTPRSLAFGFTGATVSGFGPLPLVALSLSLSLSLGLNARDMLISRFNTRFFGGAALAARSRSFS